MSQLTPQNITSIKRNTDAAIRAVDPIGLGMRGGYILDAREFESQVHKLPAPPEGGIRLAGTAKDLDLDCESYLWSVGRWQGRGFVCYVDFQSLHLAYGSRLERTRQEAVATILHEYGHFVAPNTHPLDPAVFEAPSAACGIQGLHHGDNFVRCVCHIGSRARKAGLRIEDDQIFDTRQYRLSAIGHYANAMVAEIKYYDRRTPLAAVLERWPSTGLVQLWRRDTQKLEAARRAVAT